MSKFWQDYPKTNDYSENSNWNLKQYLTSSFLSVLNSSAIFLKCSPTTSQFSPGCTWGTALGLDTWASVVDWLWLCSDSRSGQQFRRLRLRRLLEGWQGQSRVLETTSGRLGSRRRLVTSPTGLDPRGAASPSPPLPSSATTLSW